MSAPRWGQLLELFGYQIQQQVNKGHIFRPCCASRNCCIGHSLRKCVQKRDVSLWRAWKCFLMLKLFIMLCKFGKVALVLVTTKQFVKLPWPWSVSKVPWQVLSHVDFQEAGSMSTPCKQHWHIFVAPSHEFAVKQMCWYRKRVAKPEASIELWPSRVSPIFKHRAVGCVTT